MKTILLTSLAISASLFISACASHEEPVSTTTTTSESHEIHEVAPAETTTTTHEIRAY